MLINLWAILVCGILAMVIGFLWYGALFGKTWGRLIGADMNDPEKKKQMQKSMGAMYFLQFILALLQVWILAYYTLGYTPKVAVINALIIWLGFVMPTLAGTCMWNNDSRKTAWTKFFIQAGYQVICFTVFGVVLGLWQ